MHKTNTCTQYMNNNLADLTCVVAMASIDSLYIGPTSQIAWLKLFHRGIYLQNCRNDSLQLICGFCWYRCHFAY